jgi:electron transport complex protein RnfB
MSAASKLQALAARIDAVLPQTQCTRCGYPDCAAYAQAIARGEAAINQCPPGGAQGVERLAAITGRPALPLSAEHGIEAPRTLAVIDEAWCIGCTLCIKACPTDAILGANKRMHTIISEHCTGCELCIPVCPVDCIRLENTSGEATGWDAWTPAQADHARARHAGRQARLQLGRGGNPTDEGLPDTPVSAAAQQGIAPPGPSGAARQQPEDPSHKKDTIAAILARARAQKTQH